MKPIAVRGSLLSGTFAWCVGGGATNVALLFFILNSSISNFVPLLKNQSVFFSVLSTGLCQNLYNCITYENHWWNSPLFALNVNKHCQVIGLHLFFFCLRGAGWSKICQSKPDLFIKQVNSPYLNLTFSLNK